MDGYGHFHAVTSPFEILVINRKGVIRKVKCPFRVLCLVPQYGLEYKRMYYVDEVREPEYNRISYKIGSGFYPHFYFRIIISF
jgi:hypothetical protein